METDGAQLSQLEEAACLKQDASIPVEFKGRRLPNDRDPHSTST